MLRLEHAFSRVHYPTKVALIVNARYAEYCRKCEEDGVKPIDRFPFRNNLTKEVCNAMTPEEKEALEAWRSAPENISLPAEDGEEEEEEEGSAPVDSAEAARVKKAKEIQESVYFSLDVLEVYLRVYRNIEKVPRR